MPIRVRRGLLVCLLIAILAWIHCPLRPVVVLGGSMEPTLHHGQVVLLDRARYRKHPMRRGDIVVFRHQGMVQVKRVYALAGEQVWEIRTPDGECVFLADLGPLGPPRRLPARTRSGDYVVATRVPAGSLYVIGDGGNASWDSRHYGPIEAEAVLGRVLLHEHNRIATDQAVARATVPALW